MVETIAALTGHFIIDLLASRDGKGVLGPEKRGREREGGFIYWSRSSGAMSLWQITKHDDDQK